MGILAKLLIVEDDIHLRKFYTREFSEDGYHVAEAADSQEALRVLADDLPDLVMLDLVRPGQDGIELLGRLVQQTPQLPVVINTAYPVYQHNYLTWSADAYVDKSSDLTELKDTVLAVLEKHRKADEG